MGANVVIDIVLSVIALFIIIKFTVKGFLRSVLDSLKVIFAGIIAYALRTPVAKLIDSWFMRDGIVSWVKQSLLEAFEGNDTLINFVELYNNAPVIFNKLLSAFGLGDVSALGKGEAITEENIQELSVELGEAISMFLSTVIAVVVMFFVMLLVLTILNKLLDALMSFALIKLVNRVLGFALGLLCALGAIWLASLVLVFLVNVTNGFGGSLTKEVLDKSMLIGLAEKIF